MKKRFISLFSMAIMTTALGLAANAQDVKQDTPVPPAPEKKAEKPLRKGFVGAEGFRRGKMHGRKMARMRYLHGINLSDEQKQQIRAILQANRPSPEQMELLRGLIAAKRNGTITPEQQEELRRIRESARERAQSIHTQIRAILTEEQRAEIERRKQEMRERIKNRQNGPFRGKRMERPDKPVVNN